MLTIPKDDTFINQSAVSDRIVHHSLYQYLYRLWDKTFIDDSYSCRLNKGTHKGVLRLSKFARKISKNYTNTCFVLKCDIKKFFDSVDHQILLGLLETKIQDSGILRLFAGIVNSFHSKVGCGKGIPLGNLTSQIFANIYLNGLDQFIKHKLRVKYYIRYADDFILLSSDRKYLSKLIPKIDDFLKKRLKLSLHLGKTKIRKLSWGIDFLGYRILPYVVLPSTKTKQRIFRKVRVKLENLKSNKLSDFSFSQTIQSYLGYFSHASAYKLSRKIKELEFLRKGNQAII
jgi:retron-type reverse transcriptase